MIYSKRTKLMVIILTLMGLLAFSFTSCGQNNDTESRSERKSDQTPTSESPDETTSTSQETETPKSTENVPGTEIPVYPGAELKYQDEEFIVYTTGASLDDIFNFYRNLNEFVTGTGSRAVDHMFFLETELAKLIRSVGQYTGEDGYTQWMEDVETEISESASANIMFAVGLKEGTREIEGAFILDDNIWDKISKNENVLYFTLLNN